MCRMRNPVFCTAWISHASQRTEVTAQPIQTGPRSPIQTGRRQWPSFSRTRRWVTDQASEKTVVRHSLVRGSGELLSMAGCGALTSQAHKGPGIAMSAASTGCRPCRPCKRPNRQADWSVARCSDRKTRTQSANWGKGLRPEDMLNAHRLAEYSVYLRSTYLGSWPSQPWGRLPSELGRLRVTAGMSTSA